MNVRIYLHGSGVWRLGSPGVSYVKSTALETSTSFAVHVIRLLDDFVSPVTTYSMYVCVCASTMFHFVFRYYNCHYLSIYL